MGLAANAPHAAAARQPRMVYSGTDAQQEQRAGPNAGMRQRGCQLTCRPRCRRLQGSSFRAAQVLQVQMPQGLVVLRCRLGATSARLATWVRSLSGSPLQHHTHQLQSIYTSHPLAEEAAFNAM